MYALAVAAAAVLIRSSSRLCTHWLQPGLRMCARPALSGFGAARARLFLAPSIQTREGDLLLHKHPNDCFFGYDV